MCAEACDEIARGAHPCWKPPAGLVVFLAVFGSVPSMMPQPSGREKQQHGLLPALTAGGSQKRAPPKRGSGLPGGLSTRILTRVLRRRWRVVALAALSRLRVLVLIGGGLVAALADRGLIILRSGVRVLLSRRLLL